MHENETKRHLKLYSEQWAVYDKTVNTLNGRLFEKNVPIHDKHDVL